MPFYEVIYEDGSHSVAECNSDSEMLDAAQAQHDRAKIGEAGGPISRNEGGHAAVRVVKVLKYKEHPYNYRADQTVSAEVAKAELADALKLATDSNGVVFIPALVAEVRNITSPTTDSDAHESNFKMPEDEVLELKWL